MADPISCFQIIGRIPLANVPAALAYPYPEWIKNDLDYSLGFAGLYSPLQYRDSNPSASIGGITTTTALMNDPIRFGGTLSIVYDPPGNTTTIRQQFGVEFAQFVVPVNLQQIVPALKSLVAAKSLTLPSNGLGQTFSLSVGGQPFKGIYLAVLMSGVLVPVFILQDSTGVVTYKGSPTDTITGITCVVPADTIYPTGFSVGFAHGITLVSGGTAVASAAPSGTFSQTNNGHTLSGSFVPNGIGAFTLDGSSSEYWGTH